MIPKFKVDTNVSIIGANVSIIGIKTQSWYQSSLTLDTKIRVISVLIPIVLTFGISTKVQRLFFVLLREILSVPLRPLKMRGLDKLLSEPTTQAQAL